MKSEKNRFHSSIGFLEFAGVYLIKYYFSFKSPVLAQSLKEQWLNKTKYSQLIDAIGTDQQFGKVMNEAILKGYNNFKKYT